MVVTPSAGPPPEFDLWVPRDRPVYLLISGREAVLRVGEPKTVELDWTALPPRPEEPGSLEWSLTREGLDEIPGAAFDVDGRK